MYTVPSKAAEIRSYLEHSGVQVSSKKLIQSLREKDIHVSSQQVSNEKSRMRKLANADRQIDDLPVSVLKKVKTLIDELGSPEIVKKAIEELSKLST